MAYFQLWPLFSRSDDNICTESSYQIWGLGADLLTQRICKGLSRRVLMFLKTMRQFQPLITQVLCSALTWQIFFCHSLCHEWHSITLQHCCCSCAHHSSTVHTPLQTGSFELCCRRDRGICCTHGEGVQSKPAESILVRAKGATLFFLFQRQQIIEHFPK